MAEEEVQDGEEKRRVPKGCRMNEKGEMICPTNASKELKTESEKGAFFTNSKVTMTDMKCRRDKRTGKQLCHGEFEVDNPPEF